jgi:hypothetical protein
MEAIALATAPAPVSASEKVCMLNHNPTANLLTPISQAAAAARIVGKPDVIHAAKSGNLQLVKDHVVVDAGCVHIANGECDSLWRNHVSNCTRCSSPQFPVRLNYSKIFYQW